ncbi:MAG: hypothetical protein IT347_14535 [Candidatus Eisenbacteria bacterium]|nr:hypothetical protein [Candidatus Eisenbacteria bacterium]
MIALLGAALLIAFALEPPVRASSATASGPVPSPRPSAPADALARPSAAAAPLIVLSTSDVKGKSSPCGCHTPKGGLARRAALADSVRATNPNLIVVDTGGYFPEEADYEAAAVFMLESMMSLGTDAAGVGESDLRYGLGFLRAGLARTKLPVTCANLLDATTGRPVFPPFLLKTVGRAKVGFFALLAPSADLGPSRDSLRVADPLESAYRTVAALRERGATVVVLLSDLGKIDSEEVANSIPGITLVIAGHKIPLFPEGRRVGGAVVVYGGEQSQYAGLATIPLDAAGRATAVGAETVMLGPERREEPAMLSRVRTFETAFNEELKQRERQEALRAVAGEGGDDDEPRDRYLGAEVCGRCHGAELAQWKTTAHARAWATLVEQHAEARTDCVRCHVLGFRQPGGFQTDDDAPRLANVQCESCHGMGTQHDATRPAAKLTEATCRRCHDDTSSPAFTFDVYQPHILHRAPANLPPLPPKPKMAMH